MKKILTTAILCAGLFSFTACSDFLDEKPKSQLTTVGYYTTEAQALANVNYLYRTGAIRQIASAPSAYVGSFASITGLLTGYFLNSYEGQEIVCKYSRELNRQQYTMQISGTMDGIWDACYKAINVSNAAIIKYSGYKDGRGGIDPLDRRGQVLPCIQLFLSGENIRSCSFLYGTLCYCREHGT